jgi:hypothetical protein
MAGVPTAQLLTYADIIDVNLSSTNDVNFADVEDYGHRVIIEMNTGALNNFLRWKRTVGSDRPVAELNSVYEAGFKMALEAALGAGYTDIDGATTGLHFGTTNLSSNPDIRLRKNGIVSANDIPLCFVLYKLYGSSSATTLGKIYNVEDAYDMLSNTTVATAITDSFKANEGTALDIMFRDLLSVDPYRFFNTSGVPVSGIFEVNADVAGSGSWLLVENDIIEVKLKLIFNSNVTRRGVSGREHNLTSTATENNAGAQENQQTIIKPNDYFYIRLQLKSTPTASAGGTGSEIVTANVNTAIQSLGTSVTSSELSAFLGGFTASNPAPAPVITVQDIPITSLVTTAASSFDTTQTYDVNFVLLTDNTVTITTPPLVENSVVYIPIQTGTTITLIVDGISYSMTKSSTAINIDGTTYNLGDTVSLGNKTFKVAFNGSVGLVVESILPIGWATNIENTGEAFSKITVDSNRNIYFVGSYNSSLITINNFNFKNNTGTVVTTPYGTLTNSGGGGYGDIYMVKYNENGMAQWATKIVGAGYDVPTELSVDNLGNIYIIGTYTSNSVTIYNFVSGGNGGAIVLSEYGTLANDGETNTFIVKYNTSGVVQWATRIGGDRSNKFNGIVVDSSNNVYVTGIYETTELTIYSFVSGGSGNQINITSYGKLSNIHDNFVRTNAFIVKYNTNGIVQWATKVGGSKSEGVNGITIDNSGNLYIRGIYDSTPLIIYNFNSGGDGNEISLTQHATLTYGLIYSSYSSMYIIKYNTNGIAQWATNIEGCLGVGNGGICADNNGNVYVIANYRYNWSYIYNYDSIQNGSVNTTLYTSFEATPGSDSSCIVKYNKDGIVQWAINHYGIHNFRQQIVSDNNGNIYFTGFYIANPFSIKSYSSGGGGESITMTTYGTLTNDSLYTCLVSKYNTNGVAQWATKLVNTSWDSGSDIAVDNSGNVYVTAHNYTVNPLQIHSFDSGGDGGTINTTLYGSLTPVSNANSQTFIVKYDTNGKIQ